MGRSHKLDTGAASSKSFARRRVQKGASELSSEREIAKVARNTQSRVRNGIALFTVLFIVSPMAFFGMQTMHQPITAEAFARQSGHLESILEAAGVGMHQQQHPQSSHAGEQQQEQQMHEDDAVGQSAHVAAEEHREHELSSEEHIRRQKAYEAKLKWVRKKQKEKEVAKRAAAEAAASASSAEEHGSVQQVQGSSSVVDPDKPRMKCYSTTRHERMCVISPFCFDPRKTHAVVGLPSWKQLECFNLEKKARMKRRNRDAEGFPDEGCMREVFALLREAEFHSASVRVGDGSSVQELGEKEHRDYDSFETMLKSSKTMWLPRGSTWTVMQLAQSANNIAHFAGRASFMFHIAQHAELYDLSHDAATHNVLFAAPFHLDTQFEKRASWLRGFLESVLFPQALSTSSTTAREQLRHGGVHFIAPDKFEHPGMICADTAVVPGFMKARNYVSAYELATAAVNESAISPDFEALRSHVGRTLARRAEESGGNSNGVTLPPRARRKLVYLARPSKRRSFDKDDTAAFESMLREVCDARGFEYVATPTKDLSFEEQVRYVQDAAVAIGFHGANLVNSMFLPANAFLIEIFPYAFTHDMYAQALGAGLRYESYMLTTRVEAQELAEFKGDERACIAKSHDCKVFYRGDRSNHKLASNDLDALRKLLIRAIIEIKDTLPPAA